MGPTWIVVIMFVDEHVMVLRFDDEDDARASFDEHTMPGAPREVATAYMASVKRERVTR